MAGSYRALHWFRDQVHGTKVSHTFSHLPTINVSPVKDQHIFYRVDLEFLLIILQSIGPVKVLNIASIKLLILL